MYVSLSLYIYIYIHTYIYIYIYIYVHTYIYIYIERERERTICCRGASDWRVPRRIRTATSFGGRIDKNESKCEEPSACDRTRKANPSVRIGFPCNRSK